MADVKSLETITEPLKLLVYGPPGQGKTHFAGTIVPDKRFMPALFLDFEGGTRSIRSKIDVVHLTKLATHKPGMNKIVVVRIRAWSDFDVVYKVLSKPDSPYQTIIVDSLSELNYLNLQETVNTAALSDRGHDPDVPERQDYLRSGMQMRRLIRKFRDLPIHTIFTAQSAEKDNPKTRRTWAVPSLTGKLVGEVPGFMDIVGYLAIVEFPDESKEEMVTIRSLLVQPTDRFMAKARDEGGKLGDAIDEPTLPKILDLMDNGGNK